MSRRRPLRERDVWAPNTVDVVCTNRGHHSRRLLGKVELFGSEQVTVTSFTEGEDYNSLRDGFTSKDEATARSVDPLSQEAVLAQLQATVNGRHSPHITERFHCRQCGKDWPRRKDELGAIARKLHEDRHHRLDISYPELFSS
jgi:hypothetical protein